MRFVILISLACLGLCACGAKPSQVLEREGDFPRQYPAEIKN